jgi:integrase/recombinase XerD
MPSRESHAPGLTELLQEFEAALRASGRAENGVLGTLSDARQFSEFGEGRPLESIERDDVLAFLRWLETERGQKPSSMKRKLASVRLFYDFMQKQGRVEANPADGIAITAPPQLRPLPLTPGQSRRLVNESSSDRRWHVLVLLMLTAGLKRDEVLQLRWEDIAHDPNTDVTIMSIRGRSDHAANRRTLSLPGVTADALHQLRAALRGREQPSDTVLGLSARALSYAVAQCAQRADLGHLDVTPQRLRDTFAVELLASLKRQQESLSEGMSRRGQSDVRRGVEQGFLRILGVGRNRALINYYRAALIESEDADGAEGVFLRDRDFASADEL